MTSHTLHSLGRNHAFHRDLNLTSNSDLTWKSLDEIRDLLIDPPRRGNHGGGRTRGRIKLRQNPLALNNAKNGCLFTGVPCRVRSGVPMRQQTKMGLGRSLPCPRQPQSLENYSQDAHSCDVLGPQACSDCIKARRRGRLSEQARGAFPGLDTDQRSLCWSRRVKALVTPRRLPPLAPPSREGRRSQRGAWVNHTSQRQGAPHAPQQGAPQSHLPGAPQSYYQGAPHSQKQGAPQLQKQGAPPRLTHIQPRQGALSQKSRHQRAGGDMGTPYRRQGLGQDVFNPLDDRNQSSGSLYSRSGSRGKVKSRGVDYGDYNNIRLRTEMTKCPTESFSVIKRKRQGGVVTDTELHRRVMRKHLLKESRNSRGTLPEPKHLEGVREYTQRAPERTVTIVLPSVDMTD